MRKLNIYAVHLDTCIEKSVYALGPNKPHMQPGELLLLHLTKDAKKQRIHGGWTNFVLVLDRPPEYDDGTIIQQLWTDAKPEWRWLLYGSTIPTIPFSLDDPALGLSKSYSTRGMANPSVKIEKEDEEKIERHILGALAEEPELTHQRVPVSQMIQEFGKQCVLSALYNHDRIVRLRAISRGTANVEKCKPNAFLAEILLSYYKHRCQVCGSEAHDVQALAQSGLDVSTNIVVLCPNHHRIIQATNAHFNHQRFAFEYSDDRCDLLVLRDHFENAKRLAAVHDAVS